MLSDFAEKKETCLDYKKQNSSKSKKSAFPKGVNPCFWSNTANFFVYVDLVKMRLEIMLSDFPQEK